MSPEQANGNRLHRERSVTRLAEGGTVDLPAPRSALPASPVLWGALVLLAVAAIAAWAFTTPGAR